MEKYNQESTNIIEESRKEGSCLNLKSEWARAKILGLQVRLPKGVAATPTGKERREQETKEESELDTDMSTSTEMGTKRPRARKPGREEAEERQTFPGNHSG